VSCRRYKGHRGKDGCRHGKRIEDPGIEADHSVGLEEHGDGKRCLWIG
jgi:hypothetical protein